MDRKQQWEKPAEALDTIAGILTGLPIDETWGIDVIELIEKKIRQIDDLQYRVNNTKINRRVCPSCLFEGYYLEDGHKVICEMCEGTGLIVDSPVDELTALRAENGRLRAEREQIVEIMKGFVDSSHVDLPTRIGALREAWQEVRQSLLKLEPK